MRLPLPPLILDRLRFLVALNLSTRGRRYGPAPSNADSSINILLDIVQDQSGKQYRMDHYQTRFPTNVLDVASFLVRLARKAEPLFTVNFCLFFVHPGLRKTKGRTPTSGDTLFSRGAVYEIRDLPRFRSYPRSSPRTHYTGRRATAPRYELRHSLAYIDLTRSVFLFLSFGWDKFFLKGPLPVLKTPNYPYRRQKAWVSKVGL